MKQCSDKYLLGRYVAYGSQAAFSRLVERHANLVYSICYRELRQRDLADEATQSVFLALAKKAYTVRSDSALVAWLYTAARFNASVLRRQELRHTVIAQRAAEEMCTDQPEQDVWSGIAMVLDDAIEALPSQDSRAVRLRFFEKQSLREVGAALGCSEDAARMRVARALDKLRAALAGGGQTITASSVMALLNEGTHLSRPSVGALGGQSAGALSYLFTHRLFRPLHSLHAKWLIATSTAKLAVGVTVAAVLLSASSWVIACRANVPPEPLAPAQAAIASDGQGRIVRNTGAPSMDSQIEAQVARFAHGLSSGSVNEVVSVCAPGGSSGMAPYAVWLSQNSRSTRFSVAWCKVKPVTPHSATVDCEFKFANVHSAAAQGRLTLSMTLVKTKSKWLITGLGPLREASLDPVAG